MDTKNKVVIVGAGNVGTTLAYSIITQGLCREVVMLDINKEKAAGEVQDMQHACMFMERKMEIKSGDYADCADADVVVITASAPMSRDANNRLDMLASSKKVMDSIVPRIMENGFNGILLVVSNPVDLMTYYAWKLSGLPYTKVIGSGTVLDTARLTCILSDLFNINPRSIDIHVIGEHGDSEVVVWSTATIGGKSLEEIMKDNAQRAKDMTYDQMKRETIDAGWKIFRRKGNTSYGIAASVSSIIKAILNDEEMIQPVSVYLDGVYGLKEVYLSLPAVINRSGIREIVKLNLSEEELSGLIKSYAVLKEKIEMLSPVSASV